MTTMSSSHSYLQHINGLRGLAIVMVFVYHMQESLAPHGFIGVDLFLVISGYFMMKGFMKTPGEAALGNYLGRRITRIYPSYAVVNILVLLALLSLADSEAIKQTAIIGLNALAGTSNIYLDSATTGYFDTGVSDLPLVHTWYLSVLLQCYVLFALGWRFMCKWPKKRVLWVLGSVAVISFLVWNWPGIGKSLSKAGILTGVEIPSFSYYWTTGRIWELLLGGGVLLLPELKNPGKWCKWTCLGLLLFLLVEAFISFKGLKRHNFPVVLAGCALLWLLPAAGGAVLRFFNNRVMQWLGTVSFSLYLVHWPIIVFWKWRVSAELGWPDYVGIILLSLICTMLLYWLVEKRRISLLWALVATLIPAGGWCTIACCEDVPSLNSEVNKVKLRQVTEQHVVNDPAYDAELLPPFPTMEEKSVKYVSVTGEPVSEKHRVLLLGDVGRKPDCIVFGDSHAGCLRYGLDVVGRKAGFTVLCCPFYVTPFTNLRRSTYYISPEQMAAFFTWLDSHPELDKVVLVQCWAHRFIRKGGLDMDVHGRPVKNVTFEQVGDGLRDFLGELKKRGKKVALLTACPEVAAADPGKYIRQCLLRGDSVDMAQITCTQAQYDELYGRINAFLAQLETEGLCTVIHQERALLKDGRFEAWREGTPLYMRDYFHLSTDGTVISVEGMLEELMQFLQLRSESAE